MKLIDKDTVDTVLRKLWKKDNGLSNSARYAYNEALQDIQCEIDTLEVKEVDLEKEIDFAMPSKYCWSGDGEAVYSKDQMRNFAKHFFELGLSVSNEAQKDLTV